MVPSTKSTHLQISLLQGDYKINPWATFNITHCRIRTLASCIMQQSFLLGSCASRNHCQEPDLLSSYTLEIESLLQGLPTQQPQQISAQKSGECSDFARPDGILGFLCKCSSFPRSENSLFSASSSHSTFSFTKNEAISVCLCEHKLVCWSNSFHEKLQGDALCISAPFFLLGSCNYFFLGPN